MADQNQFEVPVNLLRWRCDPESLGIETTDEVHQNKEIIGQDRALRALRMGLEMKHPGYNVFVTGYTGTGRMTTIKLLLTEFQRQSVSLKDHCYLYNFRNIDQPTLLSVPAGNGRLLKKSLTALLDELLKSIPSVFESKRYQEERKRVMEHFQSRQRSVLKDFEKKVKEKNFEVVQIQMSGGMRPDIAPVIGGQPFTYEQLETQVQQGTVTKQQLDQINLDRVVLEGAMELVLREMRNIDRKAIESIDELTHRFVAPIVKTGIEEIRATFENEKLSRFLDDLFDDVMNDLSRWRPSEDAPATPPGVVQDDNPFIEFDVNILVDNADTDGIPIIIETNPKYKNLFGTIEREIDRNGVWRTDFTLIKPGSILLADGGYIVLNSLDVLSEAGVWQTLKRTLRNGLFEIQAQESTLGMSSALKPEPIKIDLKVVMIGDGAIYHLLYEQDDDFKKIFKVRADFDIEMPREEHSVRKYISFIKMVCDDEHLLPIDKSGVAAIIEHGVRLAGDQNKLSTRFTTIADVVRESNYWGLKGGAKLVQADHVRTAIHERIERVRLVEEKIREMILNGSIMIDTTGGVVGQLNGLSVYDMGEYSFGKPSRITARTSLGRRGIINVERESALSGPSHNKGVLIITGYLQSLYGKNKPLVLNASIAFEQSYGGVDGDSASSTEIYAVLSSVANLPLRQDIAVTGSVNQNGEIQPIGGADQKIEGFYDVCHARGLTGTQGVLIPHQNVTQLMLRPDIVEAITRGEFHVYAIKTIDEGIEVLTGMKAGRQNADGSFESESVHALVDATLTQYSRHWKELLVD